MTMALPLGCVPGKEMDSGRSTPCFDAFSKLGHGHRGQRGWRAGKKKKWSNKLVERHNGAFHFTFIRNAVNYNAHAKLLSWHSSSFLRSLSTKKASRQRKVRWERIQANDTLALSTLLSTVMGSTYLDGSQAFKQNVDAAIRAIPQIHEKAKLTIRYTRFYSSLSQSMPPRTAQSNQIQ